MAVEQVFIEFVVDDDSLNPAIDRLEKMGVIDKSAAQIFKQTNAELQKRSQVLQGVTAATGKQVTETNKVKKSIVDLDKSVKDITTSFTEGFQQGVAEALREAGVSAEEFALALKNAQGGATKSSGSLRTQLKAVRDEMGALALAGKDDTEQFKKLNQEAGRLQDTMNDVADSIKNAGSDTATFDGLIGAAQGVAGGFAVAQGAAALFGDESEELQETLLRVNAAMAILQGLQSIQATLQRESAAMRLLETIATKAQTAAVGLYNIVVGTSIGLMKAFKLALAATGIGLIVILLIELVQALSETEDGLERVNNQLARNKALLDDETKLIKKRTELELARAKAVGKAESDQIVIRGKSLVAQRNATAQAQAELLKTASSLDHTSEAFINLTDRAVELGLVIQDLDQELEIEGLNFQKQRADEAREALEKEEKARKDAADKARALRDQVLQDEIAAIERKLLATQVGSAEELSLQRSLVAAKAALELNQDKLTKNELLLIKEKSLKDQEALTKAYIKNATRLDFEANISRNNAELAQMEVNSDRRLALEIDNINFAAAIEIDAAEGNQTKIEEINARTDRLILDTKKKFIDEAVAYEIAAEEAKGGVLRRQLERGADDPKKKLQDRIAIIDEITRLDLRAGEKRINALNSEYAAGLISLKDYNLAYDKIIDDQAKIVEDAEARKKAAKDKTIIEDKARDKARVALVLDTAQQVAGILSGLADNATAAENAQIAAEKKKVEEQLAAGQITEKESIARMKRIDKEERLLKAQQARRDKALALFNAIISTAKGIAAASPVVPLMVLAGILGAAQIAIIASRPIPTFGKGKKGSYQGFGEIAETGPEVLERAGRRYLVEKQQVVWLNKSDKVYSPKETIQMMSRPMPSVNKSFMGSTIPGSSGGVFDYERLGKEISKNIPEFGLSVNEQGFKEWVKNGNSTTNYLNNRRAF